MDEEYDISDEEILQKIEQAESDDDSFLSDDFKTMLEEDEKYEFNLYKEINNFIAITYDEYEKALEAKKIADYLVKYQKLIVPYMNIKQVFTASSLYYFMKDFDVRVSQRTISNFLMFLHENMMLRMRADISHKLTKRNIQLFWVLGTPKKKVAKVIKFYLEVNSSAKPQEQIKLNQKKATKAIMEGAKEAKDEFKEEQTAIHRAKQNEAIQKRKPKTIRTKIHEEKIEGIFKETETMMKTGNYVDPDKALRDKKIAQEQFFRKISRQDLVKGIYSNQFNDMPLWYQELAKKIFKERTGSDIYID